MIDEKVEKLLSVDSLGPQEIAQESIELSALFASVNRELIGREMAYNRVRKSLVQEYGTAAKAKIFAEATKEYEELLEAKAYSLSVQELIRTTKKYTALMEREYHEANGH